MKTSKRKRGLLLFSLIVFVLIINLIVVASQDAPVAPGTTAPVAESSETDSGDE
ncbi:hypothetical protein GF386_04900, partial [Candidatus Pacearchaeota archaeon]|nr:hypothetical protein [Candidatus Pacearchaeota archaeon]MBD3283451.1 hypothetical protein [Candidatus Pacearchaeota archaeon]